MADVQNETSRRGLPGVSKSKKLSTRVDLTPMVDLGFLLITFFIFTTSMAEAKTLHLEMPMDSKDSLSIGESTALHIILSKDHSQFYYMGDNVQGMQKLSHQRNELRDLIISQKSALPKNSRGVSDLVVLIKATTDATYGDVLDVIDEMLINEVGRYMLLDPTSVEKAKVLQGSE